jgi:hypothetical protein
MSMVDLSAEFDKRKPWTTKYIIDGKVYGDGNFDFSSDNRLGLFFNHFQNISSVLELGSLEGGHAFALARHPGVKRVVGIEGRADSCEKARFVQDVLQVKNIEFINASSLGMFEAVFCVGLLYHLPAPWILLKQVASVSHQLFIWTHYVEQQDTSVNGYGGSWYQEQGIQDPLSGMSQKSFWPTLDALKEMLADNGFDKTEIINQNSLHPHGPEVTLVATRSAERVFRLTFLQKIRQRFGW